MRACFAMWMMLLPMAVHAQQAAKFTSNLAYDQDIAVEAQSAPAQGQDLAPLSAKSIRFEKWRTEDYDVVVGSVTLGIISYPQTQWLVGIELMNAQGEILKTALLPVKNSGIVRGVPHYAEDTLPFALAFSPGEGGLDQAVKFAITIDAMAADRPEPPLKEEPAAPQSAPAYDPSNGTISGSYLFRTND